METGPRPEEDREELEHRIVVQSTSHGSPGLQEVEMAMWRCQCGASSDENDVDRRAVKCEPCDVQRPSSHDLSRATSPLRGTSSLLSSFSESRSPRPNRQSPSATPAGLYGLPRSPEPGNDHITGGVSGVTSLLAGGREPVMSM
jgi:hypothetical protein